MSGPSFTTIENAIYVWVYACTGYAAIWKHQNAPQPPRPFIVLHIESMRKIGVEDIQGIPEQNGPRIIYGTKEFDVEIKLLGTRSGVPDNATTPVDATSTLSALLDTLHRKDIQESLRTAGAIFLGHDDVRDMTFLETDHQVERADSIIHFRTSTEVNWGAVSDGSIIATVETVGTITNDLVTITPITIDIAGGILLSQH